MIFLIEEEWEAHDIISYCENNDLKYRVLPKKEIIELEPKEFFKGPFFCATQIVQHNLKKIKLGETIPDTYSPIFNKFYGRKISKYSYGELDKIPFLFFIKSAGNDKLIDGTIVRTKSDLDELWMTNNINPSNLEFYISEVVEFVVEYRLLIGNGKIYGTGFQKGNPKIKPDKKFIDEIIKTSENKFYCTDIGYEPNRNEWLVVEINPPFALDDYDIPITNYITYAIDFWKSLSI